MGVWTFLAHLAGILFALVVISIPFIFWFDYVKKSGGKRLLTEYAIEIGSTQDYLMNTNMELDDELKLVRWFLEKYSANLFQNRFSDLLGAVWIALSWVVHIVVACLLIATIWTMVDQRTLEPILYWWAYVVFNIFLILVQMLYWYICHLLTGRYPNSAKAIRKVYELRYDELLSKKQTQKDRDSDPKKGNWYTEDDDKSPQG